jgi:oligopeptide/dipeptide ABC transporter ATP-binding protein
VTAPGAARLPEEAALVEVFDLRKVFDLNVGPLDRIRRRERPRLRAVDGVSLTINRGETLGIVGESGCGKSTLGRMLVRLEEPTSGEISFRGIDLVRLSEREIRPYRRSLQIVFQDPYSTLNPRLKIGSVLKEALRVHDMCSRDELDAAVTDLLRLVELPPSVADRYPSHLSGGQRQRVGIARALAVKPDLIVADEPVSALDVSVQAQILNLVHALKQELGVTWVFIGHNLATVRQVADRIAVMYLGRVVEQGPADIVLSEPSHPYTRALLESVPHPDPERQMSEPRLLGDPPSPISIPEGCRFAGRCALARPFCRQHDPALAPVARDHDVACWAVTAREDWATDGDDVSAPAGG